MEGNMGWGGVISKFPKQSEESFREQDDACRAIIKSVNHYGNPSRKMTTKNIIIAGVPGAGKTHVLEFSILYSISRGHFIIPITILANRALAISGIHFHKLLKYNKSYGSAQHLAEKALVKILCDAEIVKVL
jgi:hypothetical protein